MQVVLPTCIILLNTVGSPLHGHVQRTGIHGSYIDDHGRGEIYITKRVITDKSHFSVFLFTRFHVLHTYFFQCTTSVCR